MVGPTGAVASAAMSALVLFCDNRLAGQPFSNVYVFTDLSVTQHSSRYNLVSAEPCMRNLGYSLLSLSDDFTPDAVNYKSF